MTIPAALSKDMVKAAPDENWKLFLRVVRLGWLRQQHAVRRGRAGILDRDGRITDKFGEPEVYLHGERFSYNPWKLLWGWFPWPFGQTVQEVVEFAIKPGWITFVFERALMGFGDDRAVLVIHIDIDLVDPTLLWNANPELVEKDGFAKAEKKVLKRIETAVESARSEAQALWVGGGSYLFQDDPTQIQGTVRSSLDNALRGWGLRPADRIKPELHYPRAMDEVLYGIQLGEVLWAGMPLPEQNNALTSLGVSREEVDSARARAEAEAGTGSLFRHLWRLRTREGDSLRGRAALEMVRMAEPRSAAAVDLLGKIALTDSYDTPEGQEIINLIIKLLGKKIKKASLSA
jgi:hypothetical protein